MRPDRNTLSRRFAASSPLIGRGGCGACAPDKWGEIPAYAGMTVTGNGEG